MVVVDKRHFPATLPPGKELEPITEEVGSAPGPVWEAAENVYRPEFDPRIVQSVASCY